MKSKCYQFKNLLQNLLYQDTIQALFQIFSKEGVKAFLVGGCVRDVLLGKNNKDIKDIDIAVNVLPNKIIEILNKHNMSHDDYGYKYGCIATTVGDKKFQITTLREDINQTGRHTNIIFTKDWVKDAKRRDFTFNAIYLSSTGELKDPFDGKQDLKEKKIKFIGNIEERIQEDFLRIFRYYRFLGTFDVPKLIRNDEVILLKYFEQSFNFLSNDLIRQEILKMFNSSFPINCFFNRRDTLKKKNWVILIQKHFLKQGYELGLNNCLNKIDLIFKKIV